jgi:phosphoribosyl-AMP cyclohydrolase / phosphoribosyl-ATP pyrophosphohydrolase
VLSTNTSTVENPNFTKNADGLIPAIVQDARTGRVLMQGYMNEAALQQTRSTGKVTFFSRSKQRLWTKGESSGHFLSVQDILSDCDQDSLLIKATPDGPTCHTGADTCWNEPNRHPSFLFELERVIQERQKNPPPGSYTAKLFAAGTAKIAQKVGEEAVETVIEAMKHDRDGLLNESADLLYHLLVLFADQKISLGDVEAVLEKRHG